MDSYVMAANRIHHFSVTNIRTICVRVCNGSHLGFTGQIGRLFCRYKVNKANKQRRRAPGLHGRGAPIGSVHLQFPKKLAEFIKEWVPKHGHCSLLLISVPQRSSLISQSVDREEYA